MIEFKMSIYSDIINTENSGFASTVGLQVDGISNFPFGVEIRISGIFRMSRFKLNYNV